MAKRMPQSGGAQGKRLYTIGVGMGEQQVSKRRYEANLRLAAQQDRALDALRRQRERQRRTR